MSPGGRRRYIPHDTNEQNQGRHDRQRRPTAADEQAFGLLATVATGP
jgi:hypothetical protein